MNKCDHCGETIEINVNGLCGKCYQEQEKNYDSYISEQLEIKNRENKNAR